MLFIVLHGTGLRIQALLHLRVKDITFKGKFGYGKGTVFVEKSKGGLSRKTCMHEEEFEELVKYVQDKGLGQNALFFTNRKGDPYIDSSSLNKTLKRYCIKLDIDKNITCHSFRHMYITKIIEEHNKDNAKVMAGHKNSKSTEAYDHARFEVYRKKFY